MREKVKQSLKNLIKMPSPEHQKTPEQVVEELVQDSEEELDLFDDISYDKKSLKLKTH